MAATARMTTASPLGMPLGAGFTAIGLIIHHHRIGKIHNAETGGTSTFHLCDSGGHNMLLKSLMTDLF